MSSSSTVSTQSRRSFFKRTVAGAAMAIRPRNTNTAGAVAAATGLVNSSLPLRTRSFWSDPSVHHEQSTCLQRVWQAETSNPGDCWPPRNTQKENL